VFGWFTGSAWACGSARAVTEQDAVVWSEHPAAQTSLLKGKGALAGWYQPFGVCVPAGLNRQKMDPVDGV